MFILSDVLIENENENKKANVRMANLALPKRHYGADGAIDVKLEKYEQSRSASDREWK